MNPRTIITPALGLLLLLAIPACQKKQTTAPPTPAPSTDTDLGHGYVRRDGAIHFIGGGTTGTGADATRIDMPSPAILKKLVQSQYGPFKTAEGLDAASFEALSTIYTRDKNHVYYKIDDVDQFIIVQLPDADPATFSLSTPGIVRDKNHVWRGDRIMAGVDPATVEIIDSNFMVIKDKDSVHYSGTEIPDADPATFRRLGSAYYADRNKAYWGYDPIPDADPNTLVVLKDSFIAKDKHRVYRSGSALNDIDATSFELILHNEAGYQIYSDQSGVHVNHMTFPRSQPGKAEVIDDRTVKVGELILLVESSRNTPSTLFKENGKLMLEGPAYEPASGKANGIISAEVTPEGLMNIRTNPLPGSTQSPTVPDWQREVFTHSHSAERLIELGKKIK
jgi:hypothetical protein